MPTYQYRCTKCGDDFEVWQSIHDDAFTVHDGECRGALNKVLAVGGIVLKGPGFYRNDSRSSAGGNDRRGKDGRGKDEKAAESASSNGSGDNGAGKKDTDKKDTKKSESSESTASSSSKSDASKT
jgi:putative FmdB family regulatory protein